MKKSTATQRPRNGHRTLVKPLLILGAMTIFLSCQKEAPLIDLPSETVANSSEYFVSQNLASQIAQNFNFKNTGTTEGKNGNASSKIKTTFPVINQKNDTVYYIINYDPKGFIVLAADQRSIPVLAYSPNNSFSTSARNYPSGLVKWLESARNHIDDIRQNNLKQDPEIADEWEGLVYGRYPIDGSGPFDQDPGGPGSSGGDCPDEVFISGPLMTTEWNQNCGYNDYMPSLSCGPCGKAYAGCVPIAIAQVMKYHEYPTNYQWDNMPDEYPPSDETALFIKDIHDELSNLFPWPGEIDYGCGGTGVDRDLVNNVFFKFNYSSASTTTSYDQSIVTQQIDWNRPVILCGSEDNGWWIFHDYDNGHMWVCDGYKRITMHLSDCLIYTYLHLHMNWGWGEYSYNGWFFFDDFTPGNHYFNDNVEMVYNIAP